MEKIKRILSMLLVVALIISTNLNVPIYAADEETINGSMEVKFRESNDTTTTGSYKIFYADVWLYDVKAAVVGFKLNFDGTKIKLCSAVKPSKEPNDFLTYENKFTVETITDEETWEEETICSGIWSARDGGVSASIANTGANVKVEMETGSSQYSPNVTDDFTNGIKIFANGSKNNAEISSEGYKLCTLKFCLFDKSKSFDSLSEDDIYFDTSGYAGHPLGATANYCPQGNSVATEYVTSSTICYPRKVTFLDGKDSTNEPLAIKQADVSVTNTYNEATSATTQATTGGTISEADMQDVTLPTGKTLEGWYYTAAGGNETKFILAPSQEIQGGGRMHLHKSWTI